MKYFMLVTTTSISLLSFPVLAEKGDMKSTARCAQLNGDMAKPGWFKGLDQSIQLYLGPMAVFCKTHPAATGKDYNAARAAKPR